MGKKSQYFRANVGVIVIDRKGLVLGLERSDVKGAWQMPQGGLEAGEEPVEAAKRELCEETGIEEKDIRLLGEHPEWLAYELPEAMRREKTGRGQAQKWFLCRFTGRKRDVDLQRVGNAEFRRARWLTLRELARGTAKFRRPIYRRLAVFFADHLAR